MSTFGWIIVIVYVAAGWWAANRTIYANRALIGTMYAIMMQKFIVASLLGWILIPIALIKTFSQK